MIKIGAILDFSVTHVQSLALDKVHLVGWKRLLTSTCTTAEQTSPL